MPKIWEAAERPTSQNKEGSWEGQPIGRSERSFRFPKIHFRGTEKEKTAEEQQSKSKQSPNNRNSKQSNRTSCNQQATSN
jgi:hypothetical protein